MREREKEREREQQKTGEAQKGRLDYWGCNKKKRQPKRTKKSLPF